MLVSAAAIGQEAVLTDRFIRFYLPVSLLAIRLPCFNKLELSWELWNNTLCVWCQHREYSQSELADNNSADDVISLG